MSSEGTSSNHVSDGCCCLRLFLPVGVGLATSSGRSLSGPAHGANAYMYWAWSTWYLSQLYWYATPVWLVFVTIVVFQKLIWFYSFAICFCLPFVFKRVRFPVEYQSCVRVHMSP